jgi:hypothetical protein
VAAAATANTGVSTAAACRPCRSTATSRTANSTTLSGRYTVADGRALANPASATSTRAQPASSRVRPGTRDGPNCRVRIIETSGAIVAIPSAWAAPRSSSTISAPGESRVIPDGIRASCLQSPGTAAAARIEAAVPAATAPTAQPITTATERRLSNRSASQPPKRSVSTR